MHARAVTSKCLVVRPGSGCGQARKWVWLAFMLTMLIKLNDKIIAIGRRGGTVDILTVTVDSASLTSDSSSK